MKTRPKKKAVSREKKPDPFEVFKALSETNALMEEGARMLVRGVISDMQKLSIDFAERLYGKMVEERLKSVERIYRAEGRFPLGQ